MKPGTDGRIDHEARREVFVRHMPLPVNGERLWLGVDASSIPRPEADTSPDRSVVYVPNQPGSSRPISYGWQFSTVVVLPEQPSSWTYVLEKPRIASSQKSTQVAALELGHITALLHRQGMRPIIPSDRWYSCAPNLVATADLEADKLGLCQTQPRVLPSSPAAHGQARCTAQRW